MAQYTDCSQKVKVLTNEEFLICCEEHMMWLQNLPNGKCMADTIGDIADFSNIRVTEEQLRAFDFDFNGEHYSCVDFFIEAANGNEIAFIDFMW